MSATVLPPRAYWTDSAIPVHPRNVTIEMLSIAEVMERTGLPRRRIESAIFHPADHKNRRALLRPIAHPKWRVSAEENPAPGEGEPRWSHKQISDFYAIRANLQSTDKAWAHLPRLSEEDAAEAQLISKSRMGTVLRLRKTNVDRWARQESWPDPVARIDSGPSPQLLYVWRESPALEDVLTSGCLALLGEVNEDWLTDALSQQPIRDWLREHNPRWVQNHPDVDLDAWVPEL